ncbi:hypothetical protein GIS00_23220 [Nakamurella sp. YIM 132087]|uniref:NHLP leader peptide family natural product n=1 Tax=Nakamurella alba TaxID=2665158 RepID=A0A7K1FU15_9ACTN|nr:nitrile hydratase subunit alpha [Nakamurella alba]MTD16849.1 hypothetical protein [Nakamurella alba]
MSDITTAATSPLEQIQLRAAVEPEFRSALMSDPRTTLRKSGIEVPEQISIRIEESAADEFVLALPPAIDPEAELDEDALAGASGGFTPAFLYVGVVVAGTLGAVWSLPDGRKKSV